ncbi:macrolide transport system ATP-binding/permease protein [Streptomyces sp. PsTaAH-130]|nr:macrolide transport system ATP-binding/permease protein [Streptomyces sp. PsTaAH-130]
MAGREGPPGAGGQLLCLGLFAPDRLTVPVGRLSAGRLQRPALARLLGAPSDVLLLGEPADPRPPALAEKLETALSGYDGTLVVGHDRRLRLRRRGARPALPATDTSAATC